MRSFFITGTDTGIGKTYISCLLLEKFKEQGYKTFAIKPIASGAVLIDQQWGNDDAIALQKAASEFRPYQVVNPILLDQPIAPNIAAKLSKQELTKEGVLKAIKQSIQAGLDINIIEGVGGWMVPLSDTLLMSDIVEALGIPVILVIGLKLGCLNHAILTANRILEKNIHLVGWIGNCIDPDMLVRNENIQTLKTWIKAPCLGIVDYGARVSDIVFDMDKLF